MDRGAWQAIFHGVAKKSDTTQQLKNNNLCDSCFISVVRSYLLNKAYPDTISKIAAPPTPCSIFNLLTWPYVFYFLLHLLPSNITVFLLTRI